MREEIIEGRIILEDVNGEIIDGPQASRMLFQADDESWRVAFATSHQFRWPVGKPTEATWLRFDDSQGRVLFRFPMGVQDVVTIPATVRT